MITAAPAPVQGSGMVPKQSQPMAVDHTIWEYWNGASTEAWAARKALSSRNCPRA